MLKNILIGVLTNGFMLRDMRVSHHIEKWIMAHKKEVSTWFEVLHFFDGYNTLGAYAFNHPLQTYPSITDGGSVLNMQEAAHPLLDPQRAVSNTMQIDAGQFFIITGANMAGKSTFIWHFLWRIKSCRLYATASREGCQACFGRLCMDRRWEPNFIGATQKTA